MLTQLFPQPRNFTMQPGSNVITVNGEEIEIDTAPKITHGRTLTPMRVIAEALRMNVDWDESSRTVIIDEVTE